MNKMDPKNSKNQEDILNGENAAYLEYLQNMYQKDPKSVDQSWSSFFESSIRLLPFLSQRLKFTWSPFPPNSRIGLGKKVSLNPAELTGAPGGDRPPGSPRYYCSQKGSTIEGLAPLAL